MDGWASLTEKLKPFGQSINKQFIQVQQVNQIVGSLMHVQLAREKIGGQTADTTELPPEYRNLEEVCIPSCR